MYGSVYIIKPTVEHPPEDEYYGSTQNSIKQRWRQHKSAPVKAVTLLAEKYGWENLVCECLEEILYDEKFDLLIREAFYIENNPCCNKCVPARPDKTIFKKNYHKNYHREYLKRDGVLAHKAELKRIARANRTEEQRLLDNEKRRLERAKAKAAI